MFRVQLFNQIADSGLAILRQSGFELNEHSADAILLRSENLHDKHFSSNLKVVVRAGAGVNNVPVDLLTKKGIPVLNTPGANANAVKELVIGALIMAARNLLPATQSLKSLESDKLKTEVEKIKKAYKGCELVNKRLAVIGLGAIGGKVANTALDLGLKVVGYDAGLTVENALRVSSNVERARTLSDALKDADFISLHVPYFPATHHLINANLFQCLKKGAVLLNFARSDIVDETALKEVLGANLSLYVTDFPSKDLLNEPRVLAFPHLGASTYEAEENCAQMAVEQLISFLKTGTIKNAVNFPDLTLSSHASYRIALSNLNCPNMLGQITSTLASLDYNIVELANRSKGEVAYNLIDIDRAPNPILCQQLSGIKGVLNCRTLSL
jgi:D-3-phosphoglycerate dehydrogenase